ncbi:hypothetical protein pipiens_000581, partial [Culex pipiens pipiens]
MPVRRGYWSSKPHTVLCKIFGICGSAPGAPHPGSPWYRHCVSPGPEEAAPDGRGIKDCYTLTRGSTTTLGNFAKATYTAIVKTYAFLTPNLWKDLPLAKTPYQEYVDILEKTSKTGQRIIELITANKNNASDLHG